MMRLVLANIGVHLKFYRRNRLLLLVVLVLALFSLSFLSIKLSQISAGDKFRSVQVAVAFAQGLGILLGALLGLTLYSHHAGGRSLKMVFTKPCPPEAWLLSAFAAGGAILLAFHLLVLGAALAMFVAWGLPVQWGVALVLAHSFIEAFLWFGWMLFLTFLMPPLAAGAVGLLVNASLIHAFLQNLVLNAAGGSGWFTVAAQAFLKYIVTVVYVLLPETSPFEQELKGLYESFRFDTGAVGYVALSGAYVLLASALFFCGANALLRRRPLT